MAEVINVRINWDNTALKIRVPGSFFTLHIDPSTDFPFGEKGKVLASAWKQLNARNKADGMLIMDGDVAIEPLDLNNMNHAIHYHDQMVVTAPARIFPVSTKRKEWSWAHWSKGPSQVLEIEDVRYFSFNLTYLPKKVIEQAISDGLTTWTYPRCDERVSDSAFKAGVPVYVATDVSLKHLNF